MFRKKDFFKQFRKKNKLQLNHKEQKKEGEGEEEEGKKSV